MNAAQDHDSQCLTQTQRMLKVNVSQEQTCNHSQKSMLTSYYGTTHVAESTYVNATGWTEKRNCWINFYVRYISEMH